MAAGGWQYLQWPRFLKATLSGSTRLRHKTLFFFFFFPVAAGGIARRSVMGSNDITQSRCRQFIATRKRGQPNSILSHFLIGRLWGGGRRRGRGEGPWFAEANGCSKTASVGFDERGPAEMALVPCLCFTSVFISNEPISS